jgi:hypothetical protein
MTQQSAAAMTEEYKFFVHLLSPAAGVSGLAYRVTAPHFVSSICFIGSIG